MGVKGDKLTDGAAGAAKALTEALAPLGDVTSKKMFGGYGIFEAGKMFALVNSKGVVHLKADDANRQRFEERGATPHGKMPYYEVPAEVMSDSEELRAWAAESIAVSK